MSNVKKAKTPEVPIELGGKFRHLKFDLNAFAELEDEFGSVNAALDKLKKGSFKFIRTLLWAGLQHEDSSLTKQDIGSMIELSELKEVSEKVAEAFSLALPQEEDVEEIQKQQNTSNKKKVLSKNSSQAEE